MAKRNATKPPVILAVLVPPSAWITSQSTIILRSPSFSRSTTARNERPIKRWISIVRPVNFPFELSRRFRVLVALGSMLYSAVTQPVSLPRRNGGTESSKVAEQITFVSPKETTTDPSGCLKTFVSILIGRNCWTVLPSCRKLFSS